jgi:ribonuclease P protein component
MDTRNQQAESASSSIPTKKLKGLAKSERLCSQIHIDWLYSHGTALLKHPVRVVFLCFRDDHVLEKGTKPEFLRFPLQVMVSAPKRTFKRAHDRNLLKRRMREAFRQNKEGIYLAISDKVKSQTSVPKADVIEPFIQYPLRFIIGIHYIGKEILNYSNIEKKIVSALDVISEQWLKQSVPEKPLARVKSIKKRSKTKPIPNR